MPESTPAIRPNAETCPTPSVMPLTSTQPAMAMAIAAAFTFVIGSLKMTAENTTTHTGAVYCSTPPTASEHSLVEVK